MTSLVFLPVRQYGRPRSSVQCAVSLGLLEIVIAVERIYADRIMIDLTHVQAFCTVVRLNSFSAAALALATTQPSISRRIRELEWELGVTLFDTRTRRAILTTKGREFLPLADELMHRVDAITTQMTERQDITGTVRLGASETVAMTWLSSFVGAVRSQYPKVILSVDVDLADRLMNKFGSGLLDAAIVTSVVAGKGTETEDLGCFDYAWMASPTMGIPDRRHPPTELASYPIISLSDGSALYKMANRWFKDHAAVPNWVNHCSSVSMVTALTEAGLGISLLPRSLMQDRVDANSLQVIEVSPPFPTLRFTVVYGSHATSPAVLAVVRLMRACSTFYFPEKS